MVLTCRYDKSARDASRDSDGVFVLSQRTLNPTAHERWSSVARGLVLAEVLLGLWCVASVARGLAFHAIVLAGVVVGVVVGLRSGVGRGRWAPRDGADRVAFLLYALLEHRIAASIGVMASSVVAAAWVVLSRSGTGWMLAVVASAAVIGGSLGLGLPLARQLTSRWLRSAAPVIVLVGLGLLVWRLSVAGVLPAPPASGMVIAANLLLLLPLLCVLLFIAPADDTGLETAAICGVIGAALWQADLSPSFQRLTLLVPALVWFALTTRIEKPLRWLKAILEAEGLAHRGDRRGSLAAFRQAASLRPTDKMSTEGIWRTVRHLDEQEMVDDAELIELVTVEDLVAQARALLDDSPSDPVEAHRLLRIVALRDPVEHLDVWLELTLFHARDGRWDEAAGALGRILDADGPCALALAAEAWCLAFASPELTERLGRPMLDAGRRIEAILTLGRAGSRVRDPEAVEALKRILYADLREDDYRQAKAEARGVVEDFFDHDLCRRLGRELSNDASQVERAIELLRIARDRVDPCATTNEIAALYEARDDQAAAMATYEETKVLGLRRNGDRAQLDGVDEAAFVHAVTRLATWHEAADRLTDAIDHRRLLCTPGRRSLSAQIHLTQLEARRGNLVAAINECEQALMYAPKQADLLAIRRRLYANVSIEDVRDRLETVRPVFDFAWCLSEGRTVLDDKDATQEELLFARHLLWLADLSGDDADRVRRAWYLGRVHRRLGENDTAVRHLEAARDARGDQKLPRDEDDAYHRACRLLADLYIERGDFVGAQDCLMRFRPHMDSGADTYLKLGEVAEALGHGDAARKHYQALTEIYPKHPLAARARAAAERLGAPRDAKRRASGGAGRKKAP